MNQKSILLDVSKPEANQLTQSHGKGRAVEGQVTRGIEDRVDLRVGKE